MINFWANKKAQTLDQLSVQAFEKKKLKTLQQKHNIPQNHHLHNSDSSYNSSSYCTRQDYRHLPYSQFRSRLISYLSQNEHHARTSTEHIQLKRLNSSFQWSNIKKQLNNSAKNQSKSFLDKKSFKKKNIKQYISQVALAKRKKNQHKTEPNLDEVNETQIKQKNSKTRKSKRRGFSLVISNCSPLSLEKLIPIHHTQAYFYEKDHSKQPTNAFYKEETIHQQPAKQETTTQLHSLHESQHKLGQSRIHIHLERDQQDPFQGKFEENHKLQRLNEKGSKSQSKRRIISMRKKKPKKSEQQANEISPWRRRRNTVDSQPPTQNY